MKSKKSIYLLLVLATLILFIAGSYFAYNYFQPKQHEKVQLLDPEQSRIERSVDFLPEGVNESDTLTNP